MKAQGTIQSKATTIIPILFYISKSRITNAESIKSAKTEPTSGMMYSIHITPFFMFTFTLPSARMKK